MAYDELVLAPGAKPIKPNLPGLNLPGVFTVRNIPDARDIRLDKIVLLNIYHTLVITWWDICFKCTLLG